LDIVADYSGTRGLLPRIQILSPETFAVNERNGIRENVYEIPETSVLQCFMDSMAQWLVPKKVCFFGQ